jgi:hypothetical protein
MLAAVWAIKTLRPYLHGTTLTLKTDHKPLEWLMSTKQLTGQAARWALSLQDNEPSSTGLASPTRTHTTCPGNRFLTTPTAVERVWTDPPSAPPQTLL